MNNGTELRAILERVAANAISDEQALTLLREHGRRAAAPVEEPRSAARERSSVSEHSAVPERPAALDVRRQFAADMLTMAAELLEVEPSRIDPRRRIADYGMNSVMAADFIRRVEARYGVRLAATIFLEFLDLRSLIDHMFEIHHDAIRHALLGPAREVAQVALPVSAPAAMAVPASDDICALLEQLWRDSAGAAEPVAAPVPGPSSRATQQPVAIIGMSGRMPGSADLDAFWGHLEAGDLLATGVPPTRTADGTYRQAGKDPMGGAFLDDVAGFDAAFFGIPEQEATLMDPQQRMVLEQVWLAVENAGYRASALAGTKTGVFASAATTDYLDLALEANVECSPYMATGLAHSVLANRVSYQFDWRGPSELVNTACSSAAVALHRAAETIRRGECDLAVACAVNLILHSRVSDSFASGGLLSAQGACRPFRDGADGFVRGEGCGAVLLKALDRAVADGDAIHAVILASAMNHHGRASGLTAPSPDAQADVMLTAWDAGGVDPQSLDYIEANGIGSPLGDQSELLALRKAFARRGAEPRCVVGSVKANVGSLETASGMAALFKVIGAMQRGIWPGDPNAALPVADGASMPIAGATARIGERTLPLRVGLNSFGLAGVNAHLVLEQFPRTAVAEDGRRRQFVLSAGSTAGLWEAARRLADWLRKQTEVDLAGVAWTLAEGREARAVRASVVAASVAELLEALRRVAAGETPAESLEAADSGYARPRRVALPGTVFERRRYWFEPGKSKKATEQGCVDLALTPAVCFRLPLHPSAPHVVNGQAVMPLGTLLDCALRAGEACGLDGGQLRAVALLRPMGMMPEASVRVEQPGRFLIVSPDGDAVFAEGAFDRASVTADLALGTIHAGGRDADLDALRVQLQTAGLTEPLRSVRSLRVHGNEVLARWEAPADWLPEWDAFRLPPGVVGDAVVTIAALLDPMAGLQAPLALHAVTVHGEVPRRGYIHVRAADGVFDVTIASLTGVVCVAMSGVEVRPVAGRPVTALAVLDPVGALEQWSVRCVLEQVPELAVETAARAVERLGVAPERRPFFAALHKRLAAAGFRSAGDVSIPAGWEAHAALLERSCSLLRAYLQDKVTGLEVLFPDGSASLVEAVYGAASPVADAVGAHVQRSSGSVRILECGAGTGAASVAVWQALGGASARVSYDFTDVSPGLIRVARERYASAYPFARFVVFDAERDAAGQGFATGSYDIVFAANVIHATTDPGRTLQNLRGLLRPGGLLVLQECAQDQTFLLLTFGLLDGWWRFQDALRKRRQSPLLSGVEWAEQLRGAGFESVQVVGQDAGQVLLTAVAAQGKGSAEEVRRHIASCVTTAVCEALRVGPLDVDLRRPFVELGMDSVIGVAVTSRIAKSLDIALRPTALFSYPSLDTLVEFLVSRHGEQIAVPAASATLAASAVSATSATPAAIAAPVTPEPATTDIAIIGVAGRFPGAPDVDAFWKLLAAGGHAIRRVPPERWDADAYYHPDPRTPGKTYCVEGGFLDGIDQFDAPFFNITGREAEWTDPQHRIFLEEGWRALEDAGYAREGAAARRCGVFVGAGGGDYLTAMLQDGCRPGAQAFWGNTASVMAGRISYLLNVNGPSLAVDTACSSSLTAIHLACQSLLQGECDLALAGGVFVAVTPTFHVLASDGNMLSADGRCKTFDQGANGFVPGEGAGAVVLKPLQAAVRDGDQVYAVIKGSAINQDGRTNGITAPSGLAQLELLRDVYTKHGVDPGSVTLIEAHGTGTKLGDPIEFESLTAAFREHTSETGYCALGSVKTNIGHLATAAGIAGVVKALLAMRYRQIPPSLHFEQPNELLALEGSPFFVNTALREWKAPVPRAGVSSFGFGGANAHVVLEAAPESQKRDDVTGPVLLPVSAMDEQRLELQLAALRSWAGVLDVAPLLRDVAYTMQQRREHFPVRAVMVAWQLADLRTGRLIRLSDLDAVPTELHAAAASYLRGGEWPAAALTPGRTVTVPGQVFVRRRYWYRPESLGTAPAKPKELAALFEPVWRPSAAAAGVRPARVFVVDRSGILAGMESVRDIRQLALRSADCLVCGPEDSPSVWEEIARALCACGAEAPRRVVTTYLANGPAGQELAAALGPSLSTLLPNTQFTALRLGDGAAKDALTQELAVKPGARVEEVEYRGGVRHARLLAAIREREGEGLRQGATYLITGGAGKLGERLAGFLRRKYDARVVVTGRAGQAPPWVPQLGVAYLTADVTDARRLAQALATAGPVHGVFHLAGVVSGKELPAKDAAEFARVLRPKVDGIAAVDQATSGEPLELFVAFSSAAALLGDFGQCDYGMANRFLDAFSARRELARASGFRKGRTVSINWPLWRDGGMHFGGDTETAYFESSGLRYLETDEGLDALERILASGAAQAMPLVGNAARYRRWLRMDDGVPAASAQAPRTMPDDVEGQLRELVARVAKTDVADLVDGGTFGTLGLDSIMLAELAETVSRQFGMEVLPTAFFEHNTIAAMAAWIGSRYQADVVIPVAKDADGGAIAITGMSGAFPGAPDLDVFWRNQVENRDQITRVPSHRWAVNGDQPAWGGFLDGVEQFDPERFGLSERDASLLDPQHRLFLEHCWLAMENAGYEPVGEEPRNIGVFAGVQFADYEALLARNGLRNAERSRANAHSMMARRVSQVMRLSGPSEAVNTACSSSLVAVHDAVRSLRMGLCEAALAGGVSLMLTPDTMAGAGELGVLSAEGRCKTLDAAADGFVKGEGVGVVLLKPLAAALRDGDVVHAVIRGTSVNHGGAANSLTAPNPEAQAALLAEACADAGVEPDSISYLEMHGTGTKLGDPVEVQGILRAWPSRTGRCGLGSIKANIGHLEPAAGIAGLIRVVLAMQQATLPGMPHFRQLNPYLRLEGTPLYPVVATQPWEEMPGRPRRAGVSSFGFGGTNAHAVLEEFVESRGEDTVPGPWLFQLSNRDAVLLAEDVRKFLAFAEGRDSAQGLADVAFTTCVGRSGMPARMEVTASSWPELRERLRHWLDGKTVPVADVAAVESGRRVPLPSRAQARRRCWWDAKQTAVSPVVDEPGIAVLTLQAGDEANVARFAAALAEAGGQPEVKGVIAQIDAAVLNGNGDCAAVGRLVEPVRQSKVPVIAAVGVDAHGLGLHVALSADMTLLAEECSYRLVPAAGDGAAAMTALLEERMGAALASEMLLGGRRYKGSELRSRGARLVVCAGARMEEELRSRARSLSQRLRGSVLLLKNGLGSKEPPVIPANVRPPRVVPVNATAPPATAPSDTLVAATITEILRDVVHVTPPGPDVAFADMGIDSVSGVEVIRELNRRLGLHLEAAMLYDHPTPRALAAAIAPHRMAAGASA